jgi:hypothetical protein
MLTSTRRWIIAIAVALYLYFLLPATANLFFSLYHLTDFGPIYWGYSGFKAAGYYFGAYEHKLLVCVLVAGAIILLPALYRRLRRN